MRRKLILLIMLLLAGLLGACRTFIREDQVESIRVYEKGVYRTKLSIEIEKRVIIEKNSDVRLYLVYSKSWIKVYAYPADADFLKTDRSLMVYMFEDDFENKLFDEARFREKLNEFVELQQ